MATYGGLDFELGVGCAAPREPHARRHESRRRRPGDGALVIPDAPPRSVSPQRPAAVPDRNRMGLTIPDEV